MHSTTSKIKETDIYEYNHNELLRLSKPTKLNQTIKLFLASTKDLIKLKYIFESKHPNLYVKSQKRVNILFILRKEYEHNNLNGFC